MRILRPPVLLPYLWFEVIHPAGSSFGMSKEDKGEHVWPRDIRVTTERSRSDDRLPSCNHLFVTIQLAQAAAFGGVDVGATAEKVPLCVSFSTILPISIEPLKNAPSSIRIWGVVKSPVTEPSFLISIRFFARTFPFTLPDTTTSAAMMSAVTLAVVPIVSFPS